MPPRKWYFFSGFVLISAAIWIAISVNRADLSIHNALMVPQQGFAAPDFSLETISGDTITLSDLKGKPIIINFWASWCLPCRSEMPAIQKAYNEFRDQGLVILAVNAANQDNLDKVQTFINEFGLTFPVLIDAQGEVDRLYQVSALPTTFFIQPDGIIQEVVIGGPMGEALLLTRIDRLWGNR